MRFVELSSDCASAMHENSPCLTHLEHEAAFQSRLYTKNRRRKRFSARELLNACVRLVNDFKCEAPPDIAPDDHAKAVMPSLHVQSEQDEIFLTQVLYGCCRYEKLLKVFTTGLFNLKSPVIQCIDEILYTVLGYLTLIRLEELTFNNFKKLVLSQHPQKLLPFVQFTFSLKDISTCKPEWIKIYDTQYVDDLIKSLAPWTGEAESLCKRLEEKVLVVKEWKKHHVPLKPFNLSANRGEPTIKEEEEVLPFKANPIPKWKEGPTSTEKALKAACEASRDKRAKFYASPKNQPFHLCVLERPSRFLDIKEEVKLTVSSVLREHALYERKLKQEEEKLKTFEVSLRDDHDFKCWQEKMKLIEQEGEAMKSKLRKAAIGACDQAAADARCAKVQENRERVKKVKDEAQKLTVLMEEFLVNIELFNRLRRENIMEGQKAVKALAMESRHLMKKFDRETLAGHGLLGEMSISELQENLILVKQAIKKEEQLRRLHIHGLKEENANRLCTKSDFVKKMRQIAWVEKLARKGGFV